MKTLFNILLALSLVACGPKPTTSGHAIRTMTPAEQPDVSTQPVVDATRETRDAVRDTSTAIKDLRTELDRAEREVEEAKTFSEKIAALKNLTEATNTEMFKEINRLEKEYETLWVRHLGTVRDLKDAASKAESRASRAESLVEGLREKVDKLTTEVTKKNKEAAGAQKAVKLATILLDEANASKAALQTKVDNLETYKVIVWRVIWIAIGILLLIAAIIYLNRATIARKLLFN